MFNFNSEVFLIFYPHGAGGRFLQSVMCLDTSVMSVALHNSGPLGNRNLFDRLKVYLANNKDAHLDNSGHLPKYDPAEMRRSDRYVFCNHQHEWQSGIEFFKQCSNLKIIIITMSSDTSVQKLDARRKYIGKDIENDFIRNTYRVKDGEVDFLAKFTPRIEREFDTPVTFVMEVSDYWDPEIAIPMLNNFFIEQNIDPKNWEELYHIWLSTSINPDKK